jgi:hypothetical protein
MAPPAAKNANQDFTRNAVDSLPAMSVKSEVTAVRIPRRSNVFYARQGAIKTRPALRSAWTVYPVVIKSPPGNRAAKHAKSVDIPMTTRQSLIVLIANQGAIKTRTALRIA